MRIAACQLPDIRQNSAHALSVIASYGADAGRLGARIVCFPEGYLQGYTTDPEHVARVAVDVGSDEFSQLIGGLRNLSPTLIFGLIEREGDAFYNSAVVIERGTLTGRYRKRRLLKGERSVFEPGVECPVFEVCGVKFGINICYDLCFSETVQLLALAGAELVVCPCNNMMRPPQAEEWKHRHNEIRAQRAREAGVWLLSSDVTGERDGRISYGPTAVIDPHGAIVDQVPLMKVGTVLAELH